MTRKYQLLANRSNHMTDNSTRVDQMLGDKSFHIEFHGYLSNHAKHAVIALNGLV